MSPRAAFLVGICLAALVVIAWTFRDRLAALLGRSSGLSVYVDPKTAQIGNDSAGRPGSGQSAACIVVPGLPLAIGCGETYIPKT
jgi:hypothetical protein